MSVCLWEAGLTLDFHQLSSLPQRHTLDHRLEDEQQVQIHSLLIHIVNITYHDNPSNKYSTPTFSLLIRKIQGEESIYRRWALKLTLATIFLGGKRHETT